MDTDASWADLTYEALVEIFKRIGFEDLYLTVPLVCKAWRRASLDGACWQRVNMEECFVKRQESSAWWQQSFEKKVDYVVKLVIDRSNNNTLELRTRHCSNASILYLASRCFSIQVISIPSSSGVTDTAICEVAKSCSELEELDVSECQNVTDVSLEEIGSRCKDLKVLRRNRFMGAYDPARKRLLPQEYSLTVSPANADREVLVLSSLMPNLKHLELRYSKISDQGLATVVDGCTKLEHLDLVGCPNVTRRALDQAMERLPSIKVFLRSTTPVRAQLDISRYGHWQLYDERFQSGFFQF